MRGGVLHAMRSSSLDPGRVGGFNLFASSTGSLPLSAQTISGGLRPERLGQLLADVNENLVTFGGTRARKRPVRRIAAWNWRSGCVCRPMGAAESKISSGRRSRQPRAFGVARCS